jgi:hypothetical protein
MTQNKTDKLTLRIAPDLKNALRELAVMEHRTVTNMLEAMIIEYCRKYGIVVHSPPVAGSKKDL